MTRNKQKPRIYWSTNYAISGEDSKVSSSFVNRHTASGPVAGASFLAQASRAPRGHFNTLLDVANYKRLIRLKIVQLLLLDLMYRGILQGFRSSSSRSSYIRCWISTTYGVVRQRLLAIFSARRNWGAALLWALCLLFSQNAKVIMSFYLFIIVATRRGR